MKVMNTEEIKQKAEPILREEGATRAALFGSVVRGEAKESSDIDILVDLPRGKTLFDLAGIKIRLEKSLGREVSCAMAIFLLKVNHGMIEKSKTDITTQGERLPVPILGGLSAK